MSFQPCHNCWHSVESHQMVGGCYEGNCACEWTPNLAGFLPGTPHVTEHTTWDMVDSPTHYNQGDIECIDAIRSALGTEGFLAYCRGNAIKYLWRAGLKGEASEDLAKAKKYLEFIEEKG